MENQERAGSYRTLRVTLQAIALKEQEYEAHHEALTVYLNTSKHPTSEQSLSH